MGTTFELSVFRRTAFILAGTVVGGGLEWIPDEPSPWRWLPLGLVYLAGAGPIARESFAALRKGRLSIDALMGMAAVGAAIVGQPLEGAILIFLFSLSNDLEALALGQTRRAITALMDLRPEEAIPVGPDGRDLPPVPVDALTPGERVRVRPGERVPTDGRVVEGRAEVDQSAITGEAIPVRREPGEEVFAATIVSGGSLVVEVTRRASESLVARIIQLVEEARENKAPAQSFIDRFAHPYAVGVVVVTAAVALLPPLFGWAPWDEAFYRAMTLLVVASPCALIISTPSAVLSGIANGARNGVLFKGGGILDRLGGVDMIAFDKTGTLTVGRPGLLAIREAPGIGESEADLLRWAASVEATSEHHLAGALLRAAETRSIDLLPARDFEAVPGEGVRAHLHGGADGTAPGEIWVGNETMARRRGLTPPDELLRWRDTEGGEGRSVVLMGDRTRVLAALAFGDELREGARGHVQALERAGIRRVSILSGDHPEAVRSLARTLGVADARGGLLPPDKVEAIESFRREGATVAMVGDGVNDAPAMAAASVGIAMGAAGTDVAIETADVVLMADDLARVPFAIRLARRSRRIVRQNVYFSVGWMALLVLITATTGISLTLAVVAHEGSTLLVVLNGLRLLRGPKATG